LSPDKVPQFHKNRNLLFDFKNGTDHTPIPLFADSVKRFASGVHRIGIRSVPAQPKLSHFAAHFCDTSFLLQPAVYDSAANLTTIYLSRRYRQQRDPAQHRPEPPPVQMSFRQRVASNNAHV